MAPHSSTLAWKIPWTEEPGRLQSMGSRRVRHDCATSLSLFTFMHWRRKWQPTPVFLPGESQERGSLVACRLWGRTESDTTEATQQQQQQLPGKGLWLAEHIFVSQVANQWSPAYLRISCPGVQGQFLISTAIDSKGQVCDMENVCFCEGSFKKASQHC